MPTILCVDDDPDVLEVLKEYFTRHGFRVVTAVNGVEAMFQVQRYLPQAVILDLFMPRLGGLGALDRIRRLLPGIATILISGVSDAVEMVTEAGVGVAGVLPKPLNLDQLLGTLARAGVVPPQARPAAAPNSEAPSMRKRVLVVDDEPETRDLLAEYLERKGFEVLQADGGEEALRRVAEFRPQVVLLDIRMPGLDGVETLRRIKALAQETPVIMVSGIEEIETARQTLASGASDYIAKPVDFQYLDSVLEAHLFMTQI
ncbi:MAG: response regulator [Candidatus Rokubacteria bacterium]|nr:response regulator [Candidatus Rokubacteria bacterium]